MTFKQVFQISKVAFDLIVGLPALLAYVPLVVLSWRWLSGLAIYYRLGILLIIATSAFVTAKRFLSGIRDEYLRMRAHNSVSVEKVEKEKKEDALRKAVPSERELKSIYRYAQHDARRWASDGELWNVTYSLDLREGEVSGTAQIYIRSNRREETLLIHLPSGSRSVQEGNPHPIEKESTINSFPCWHLGILRSLERVSSDIKKSDSVHLQIISHSSYLGVNFDFRTGVWKDEVVWARKFKIKDRSLIEGDENVVCELDC